jgi:hypothetical protein
MNRKTTSCCAGFALLILLGGACTSSAAQVHSSPSIPVHSFAGGCSGTSLTDALPPVWAQGGWNQPSAPWGVPWAFGTGENTVAYVFATQLVAGVSPRVDGTNNKVLWEAKDDPTETLVVEGRPLGQSQPVVTIAGGPSIVDVPTAGCWTFHLSWGPGGRQSSTINFQVLPAGSAPSPIAFQLFGARPLKLPVVAAGSPCPVSAVTLLGGTAPRVGTPLRLGFGNSSGPQGAYAFNKTVWDFASAPLVRNVLLRGSRLDNAGTLYFGGVGVSRTDVAVTVTDLQGAQVPFYGDLRLPIDSSAAFYTYPTGAGCYGIQADSDGFSEVIVFKAI